MDEDRHGLPLTTASTAAARFYREGIDLLLSAWPGADAAFDAAIAADPDFALAHLARGRYHQAYAETAAARDKAATARRLVANATPREQSHVAAIAAAIEGRGAEAIAAAEQHLESHPRDAFVLSTLMGAFGLYAFSGRADHDAARVAICERHARHYRDDWWFTGYLGWSHTEAGSCGVGRILAERALELRRANANAAHALAHALFEQGEFDACRSFMDDWLPGYDASGILNGHLCWHLALGALDQGDTAGALGIYEQRIRPAKSLAAPLNRLTDAASLLWRLELAGSARDAAAWQEVLDYAAQWYAQPGLAFADVHHAMAVAGADRGAAGLTRAAAIDAAVAANRLPAGPVTADLYRGLLAFGQGDFAAAIPLLDRARSETVRIGGSHAQREIVEDTLIVACLRSDRPGQARQLIDERLHRRPSARDAAWRTLTTAA